MWKERNSGKNREKRDRHGNGNLTRRSGSDEEEKSRKRSKGDDDAWWDGDDEMDAEDEDATREKNRLDDLKDRDALADSVDRKRTKELVEDWSSRNSGLAAEAARRWQLADDSRLVALPFPRYGNIHDRSI